MSGYGKHAAGVLSLVLACLAFTGAALAENGGGNGNSDQAPGQEQKAEAHQAAAPPGQEQKAEEQAPAATTQQQASTSTQSKGQATKAAKTESNTNQTARASGPGVKPSSTTTKWTQCSTGGGTGTSATCTAAQGTPATKPDVSKQYGNGTTAAQIANGNGAPAGTMLTGPGNSQPHKVAVCPKKNNKSGGVDVHAVKSYSTAACAAPHVQEEQKHEAPHHPAAPPTTKAHVAGEHAQPTITASAQSAGVAGAQVALSQPSGGKAGEAGGALGALAAVGRAGALPFTGLPLWIVALLAFALLGGGFAVRRAASA